MDGQKVALDGSLVKVGGGVHVFAGFERIPGWAVQAMRRATTATAPLAVEAARTGRLQSLRRQADRVGLHRDPGGAEVAPAIERDRVVVATDDQLMRGGSGGGATTRGC